MPSFSNSPAIEMESTEKFRDVSISLAIWKSSPLHNRLGRVYISNA
jgi:hypothetical protein